MKSNNQKSITIYKIDAENKTFEVNFFQMRVVESPKGYEWMIGQSIHKIKSWVDKKWGLMERVK